jgi:formylglycine-generating enzyme required for sulfatase activity
VKHFNDEELVTLCHDYFPEVYQNFSDGMTKNRKALALIGYCESRGLLENLHATLEKERPDQRRNFVGRTAVQAREIRLHEKTGIELIRIPAGEFLFGDALLKIDVPSFWIGRSPVTYQQYSRFLIDQPDYDRGNVTGGRSERLANSAFPRDMVTWFDAIAFCSWAGLRLPSEEEWEKAARGTDGRIFPWGNDQPTSDRCNFRDHIGGISRVGAYSPARDSPYGCVDMSGNLWEWTSSEYESDLGDDWNTLILKGGCYGSPAEELRCAAKVDIDSSGRGSLFGFRVAANG